ncbi:MAG TPA: LysM domain-containing protein, partial [Chitinophagaceae bacterium]|nr:LysM domain-containing protein [Chitinophagaceae bacterium]
MRKLFTAIIVLLTFSNSSSAQDKLLVVEGTSPNLYINHIVLPKENYYSVGRLYNVSPKDLAPYNNLTFETGLALGLTIKIPLGPNNFSQGEAPNENEVLVPVYHITKPKEGLYRVSVTYNKVPLDALKKWNRLQGDAVGTGTKLIVGYLKVLKDQSPLASQAIRVNPADFVVKKTEEKKPPVKTPEEKVQEHEPIVKKPAEVPVENTTRRSGTIDFNGGKFKSLYGDQIKSRTLENEFGVAAIFKTTSGWQDGKYYCFHNSAEPGTIIKI